MGKGKESSMKKVHHPSKPHFFQPLLPNFLYNFSIPKSFAKYLGESKRGMIREKAELRDKRGRSWYIKLVKSKTDDKPYFKDGWKRFCKHNELQVGDFLVFRHHGNFVFDVLMFAPTACERQLPHFDPCSNIKRPNLNGIARNLKGLKKRINKGCAKAKVDYTPRGFPYCHTFVKPYCLKWGGMLLPMKFARKNNLADRRCDITLIDEKGDECQLPLRYHKQRTCVYIGKWRAFLIKHNLKIYDPLVFELIASGETPILNFYK